MTTTRVAAYAALLLTLAACGGTDDPGADAVPSPTPSTSPSATESSPTVTQPSEPVQFRLVTEVGPAVGGVDCAVDPAPVVETPSDQPVTACDRLGLAHRLEPAAIVGGVESATADLPEGRDWTVTIDLDDAAAAAFADQTTEIAGTGQHVAIVQGGLVLSAPSVLDPITGGQVQITGTLGEADARELAAALEAGG
jgi:preprotein translocase subunit SecD